jgi:hypothetical protein
MLNVGYLIFRKGSFMIYKAIRIFGLMFILTSVIIALNKVGAGDEHNMEGWGIEDLYNRHYDVKEFEKIRAWVKRIKTVTPMPGMSPGVALDVWEGSEEFEVHIAPVWFVKPGEIGVKPGDRIKIKGVWAEVNGKDIFMASKIKKGDYWEFKVRLTKNGKPFWAMAPEEFARERSPQQQ